MLEKLKPIIEGNETRLGFVFDLTIQALVVISLVVFSIETLPDCSAELKRNLWIINCVIVVVFSIEYLLRVLVADDKRKFMCSFFGIVDLVAILPFFLSLGVDLRGLRAFRLLRFVPGFQACPLQPRDPTVSPCVCIGLGRIGFVPVCFDHFDLFRGCGDLLFRT